MELTDLRPPKNSKKKIKRVGRGPGCHGKTCGRGSKGQSSRSGGTKGPGFEGGQTPWYRRLPKFKGFHNPEKVIYKVIGLGDLERLTNYTEITPQVLKEAGLIKNLKQPIKVLANDAITRKVTVKLHKFSENAKAAIESAGGKIEVI